MSRKIYFDMDGTVYDLYGISNWLELLEKEDVSAFTEGKPLFDEKTFYKTVSTLLMQGWEFGVITWTPMQASHEYREQVAAVKRQWCKYHLPFITSFAAIPYGMPKQKAIEQRTSYDLLLDDNTEVCQVWGKTMTRDYAVINSFSNVQKILESLIEEDDTEE